MHELWNVFLKTGKVEDYLAFREADKNERCKEDVTQLNEHKDGRPRNS